MVGRAAEKHIRRSFLNVIPRQIGPIPWGWENAAGAGGTFVRRHLGEIKKLDLLSYFDWDTWNVSGALEAIYPTHAYGTMNMKSIFITAYRFLGWEQLLTLRPSLLPVAEMYCAWNEKLLTSAPVPIAYFFIGDDYAHNSGLFVSPELWREWICPALSMLVSVGKAAGCKVCLHSDGDIHEILDDLLCLGFYGVEYQPIGKMVTIGKAGHYRGMKMWPVVPEI